MSRMNEIPDDRATSGSTEPWAGLCPTNRADECPERNIAGFAFRLGRCSNAWSPVRLGSCATSANRARAGARPGGLDARWRSRAASVLRLQKHREGHRQSRRSFARRNCRRRWWINHAAFAAFEAGTVVANYYVYRLLVRHRHRSIARLGQTINLSALSWTVEHNYRLLSEHQRLR